jgi:hypothetical protein
MKGKNKTLLVNINDVEKKIIPIGLDSFEAIEPVPLPPLPIASACSCHP